MGFLQEAFRRADPVTGDPIQEPRSAEHVTGNSRLKPAEQVDIYRRQYWLRHVDSLLEDYPGVKHILGEDAFEAFCRAYLVAHPPHLPSLRDLGVDIVAFAERYPDFPEGKRAAALEMIRYEFAFVDLFDGADVPPLDPQKLQRLPADAWDRARIVLHPLLVRFRLEYPVHRLRLAAKADEAPPSTLPAPASIHLVLFRRGEVISFEELEPVAFELLSALASGEPLVGACDRIAEALEPAEAEAMGAQVGPWFQRWTTLSWIVDVELPAG